MVEVEVVAVVMITVMVIVVLMLVIIVEIHLQSFILQQGQQLLVEQLGFGAQELGHLKEERVVGYRGSHNVCLFPLRATLVG